MKTRTSLWANKLGRTKESDATYAYLLLATTLYDRSTFRIWSVSSILAPYVGPGQGTRWEMARTYRRIDIPPRRILESGMMNHDRSSTSIGIETASSEPGLP